MSLQPKRLWDSTVIALKWSYIGTVAKFIFQFGIQVILARLLGPEPFGVVAIVWIVLGLGNLVADAGFGPALVQRPEVSESDIRFVFTLQSLLGIAFTAAVGAAAGLLARLWQDANLVPVLRAAALIFLLQSLGQTATSLLRREMRFKAIQTAQIASYVLPFAFFGIPAAFLGLGVWSLVGAQLLQTLMYSVIAYALVRHPLLPTLRGKPGLSQFGAKVVGTNLVNWVISNGDNLAAGRVFGVSSLGLYSRAFNLGTMPVNMVVGVLQSVLFPAYARAQQNKSTVKKTFLASTNLILIVMMPLFGGIAAAANTVIAFLYGARWLATAPLLAPLAIAMPCQIMVALAGPLVWGVGRVERELAVQSVVAVLFIGMLWLTTGTSLQAVAWGVLVVYVIRAAAMIGVVVRLVGVSCSELTRTLRGGFVACALTVAVVAGLEAVSLRLGLAPVLALALDGVGSLAVLACVFWLSPRLMVSTEGMGFVVRLAERLPGRAHRFVMRAAWSGVES